MQLTPTQKLILITMMAFADWDRDVAWVTRRRLAEHLGMNEEVVRRNIRVLRQLGLVGDPVVEGPLSDRRYGFELRVRGVEGLPPAVASVAPVSISASTTQEAVR